MKFDNKKYLKIIKEKNPEAIFFISRTFCMFMIEIKSFKINACDIFCLIH